MKKNLYATIAFVSLLLVGCNGNNPSSSTFTSEAVENYFVINTNSIRNEMLLETTAILNPSFTNLGEECSPKYKVEITLNDEDVTEEVYNATTKVFDPKELGEHRVTFTVLNDDGTIYETKNGSTFKKTVIIDVVILSFAAIDSDGVDTSVNSEGVLTFGDSYKNNASRKIDSGQYKVTGVTFEGSYSITYKISDIVVDTSYSDPALYFGWIKDWKTSNDDSIKFCTSNGRIAAWIWGKSGDIADLSINKTQGWTKGGWYDAPGSVSNDALISGEHTITFERYVNDTKKTAIYGIKYDNNPFTYLNVGSEYSDVLTNVWVESVNTSCSISVDSYRTIEDKTAPTISLSYISRDYFVGDEIDLKVGATLNDDSDYASILVPSFKVYDSGNLECAVDSGKFTPYEAGTYKVVASVSDLGGNLTTSEAQIVVKEVEVEKPNIDLSNTCTTAQPNGAMVIYASATLGDESVPIDHYVVKDSNGLDVTNSTLFEYVSIDESKKYTYFESSDSGNYVLTAFTADGTSKSIDINVDSKNTTVYGFTYYDLGNLRLDKNIIIGNGMIIFKNNTSDKGQTVKLGMNVNTLTNWTIEFDITDLKYSAQGKLFVTKSVTTADGVFMGWEDLTLGGNVNDDLWGFESNVYGSGWISYQWRSVWQSPVTTEFMPDPSDHSKGCGREASAYSQYGTGTHHYAINCSTDENGVVTYKYYIDNELEVVHVTENVHKNGNSFDFIQFSSEKMNGIVENITLS